MVIQKAVHVKRKSSKRKTTINQPKSLPKSKKVKIVSDTKQNRTKSKKISPASVQQLIEIKAYEFYVRRGRIDGFDEIDWVKAEVEVMTDLGC